MPIFLRVFACAVFFIMLLVSSNLVARIHTLLTFFTVKRGHSVHSFVYNKGSAHPGQ